MGLRKGYYRDNGEDAYMMAVMRLDDAYRDQLNGFGAELGRRVHVIDRWWSKKVCRGKAFTPSPLVPKIASC